MSIHRPGGERHNLVLDPTTIELFIGGLGVSTLLFLAYNILDDNSASFSRGEDLKRQSSTPSEGQPPVDVKGAPGTDTRSSSQPPARGRASSRPSKP